MGRSCGVYVPAKARLGHGARSKGGSGNLLGSPAGATVTGGSKEPSMGRWAVSCGRGPAEQARACPQVALPGTNPSFHGRRQAASPIRRRRM